LDERVAFEELFEDFVLMTDEGDATGDTRMRLRAFMPRGIGDTELGALGILGARQIEGPTAVGARWYLKAAQLGPVPDAVVFFWLAIEALVESTGKDVTKTVEKALSAVHFEFAGLTNSVGRLFGLRAEIVHNGDDAPSLLGTGFYDLEEIVRVLLRASLGIPSTWPARVGLNTLSEPTKSEVDRLREGPSQTHWDPPIQGLR
jgi:hypothetical protein